MATHNWFIDGGEKPAKGPLPPSEVERMAGLDLAASTPMERAPWANAGRFFFPASRLSAHLRARQRPPSLRPLLSRGFRRNATSRHPRLL